MKDKKGGRTEHRQAQKLTEEIGGLAEIPGALEMLVTVAGEKFGPGADGGGKQVRMFNMGGYAEGGATDAAEMTRKAGRGDDEVLVHMSPEEYEAIESMWGKADVNPNTGMPEYGFLSKIWKKVKKVVKKVVKSPLFSFIAPLALNVFAPGLGSAVGGWLGATGKAAATIGNTIVRGGIGAISGGKDGAISGVLSGLTSGGVGSKIGSKLGLGDKVGKIAGDALLGGAAGEATGVGFAQGATGQALSSLAGNPMQKLEKGLTDKARGFFGTDGGGITGRTTIEGEFSPVEQQDPFGLEGIDGAPPAGPMSPVPGGGGATTLGMPAASGDPSLWDRASGWMKDHPYLTAGGALLAGSALSSGSGQENGAPPQLPDNFTTSLPNLSFDRQAMPEQDYFNYGRASADNPGEANFFQGNSINGLPPATPPGGGGGPPGGGGPGPQPRQVRGGVSGMVEKATMQSQGWQLDGNMLYPPGWFGAQGNAPLPPATAMRGGPVHAYKLGGLVQKYAEGGSAHVKGPGSGRDDVIPAVLSDGEYVIDSESVALLGDGSTDAGAKRLDEMRDKLRKHKGKKLAKGGFSDAAKTPEQYMAKGGDVKKGAKGSGLKDLKRLATRLEMAITSGNKKRVGEISAQLKSLDGGEDMVKGLAKGGSVKRIIDALERNAETDYRGTVEGKVERRLRDRRQRERGEGDGRRVTKLSDAERAKLAEELGGFKPNSRFIRNLKKQLADNAKETS